MIAGYVRISTSEQNSDMQVREIVDACAGHPYRIYEDHYTGTSDDRVNLQRLLSDARLGIFKKVIIFKMDRLSRNVRDFLNIQYELDCLGVEIVSLHDVIDIQTPSGRAMLHITAAMGQLEVENIRMRTRAGLAAARARGVRLGPPERVLDTERLQELLAAKVRLDDIALELGFSKSHLYKKVRKAHGSIRVLRKPS